VAELWSAKDFSLLSLTADCCFNDIRGQPIRLANAMNWPPMAEYAKYEFLKIRGAGGPSAQIAVLGFAGCCDGAALMG